MNLILQFHIFKYSYGFEDYCGHLQYLVQKHQKGRYGVKNLIPSSDEKV